MLSRLPILIAIVCITTIWSSQTTDANDKPIGRTFYVSVNGADDSNGSIEKPFKTIQKAADLMQAGDTCYIREGTYPETVRIEASGKEGQPISFKSFKNERVIIDGTEPLIGQWARWKENIYRTHVKVAFEQIFRDGEMMTEARWPNMSFPEQLWDETSWASSGKGSRYGKMIDPSLEATNIDWTGAVAVLNVAHQFRTWTRKVLAHQKGNDTFSYEKNLSPITSYVNKTTQWEDDRYYLVGKLEALDAPGEWFLDNETMELYVYSDGEPEKHSFKYKTRDYGFEAKGEGFIELVGFHFFGTTINLNGCDYCLVEKNSFQFPTFSREFNDPGLTREPARTQITGNNNRVVKNWVAFGQEDGIVIRGSSNLIANNIIHDVAWSGQGYGVELDTTTNNGNVLTENTVFNTGYSALKPIGEGNWEVSYNHLYQTCLAAKDCAVIQTGNWKTGGSRIHHNWVHDAYPSGNHPGGLKGGLGIRGDDQTRGLTVHHNVVWNCGRDGIIVKGDFNKVYNNTVFDIGSNGLEGNYISMHTEAEPLKPWREQAPLLAVQNLHSVIFNNAAFNISGDRKRTAFTPEENLSTNYYDKDLQLNNSANFEFMPLPDSPLIDAGSSLGGLPGSFNGDAPDIGAYEHGQTWKPGADWIPD